jgi:hypothetical protein
VDERALARLLHIKEDWGPCKIATKLGELRGGRAPSHSAISFLLRGKRYKINGVSKRKGRKRRTTKGEDARLVKVLDRLQAKYGNRREVTAQMLLVRWRTKADREHNTDPTNAKKPKVSTGIVSSRLRENKRGWKRLVERIDLTAEDRLASKQWGKVNKKISKDKWKKKIMVIDNKTFTCRTNKKGRAFSQSTAVRGAYLGRGNRFKITKPSKFKHRMNTGQGKVEILAGVVDGKVAVWHEVRGKWCSKAYADIVDDVITPAMHATGAEILLRDNDPKGYDTYKGAAAEQGNNLAVKPLPARRPDLNVCDYWLWNRINREMRATEAAWPTTRKERFEAWKARLKSVAQNLPQADVYTAQASMHRRCRELETNNGTWIKRDA